MEITDLIRSDDQDLIVNRLISAYTEYQDKLKLLKEEIPEQVSELVRKYGVENINGSIILYSDDGSLALVKKTTTDYDVKKLSKLAEEKGIDIRSLGSYKFELDSSGVDRLLIKLEEIYSPDFQSENLRVEDTFNAIMACGKATFTPSADKLKIAMQRRKFTEDELKKCIVKTSESYSLVNRPKK